MLLALLRLLRDSRENRRAEDSRWGLLKGLWGAMGSELHFFLMFHTEGGSLAQHLEVAAGPPATETSAAQSPVCGCGKDGGWDKRRTCTGGYQIKHKVGTKLPPAALCRQLSHRVSFAPHSVQKHYPHLPAGVTPDLVTGQCFSSTKLPLWPSFTSLR